MNTNIRLRSYLVQAFLELKMFRAKFVEEINPQILFYNFFFKYCNLRESVKKI